MRVVISDKLQVVTLLSRHPSATRVSMRARCRPRQGGSPAAKEMWG